mmetsp:Transcript_14456/g.36296  ORF Transcript_14456/g.36296 Transcript_14456/m.36296 type:complete len:113 (+) Transcript_14456:1526-1864(+)
MMAFGSIAFLLPVGIKRRKVLRGTLVFAVGIVDLETIPFSDGGRKASQHAIINTRVRKAARRKREALFAAGETATIVYRKNPSTRLMENRCSLFLFLLLWSAAKKNTIDWGC